MEDFIIPIDNHISDFINHLVANPRTILSSKFGDGKSYFLNSVKSNQQDDMFKFLTIYPVNYQIASNEDIFQLIKRDIFFQLMLNNMLPTAFTFPNKSTTFWFFIKNEFKSLAADLIPYLAEINLSPEQTTSVLTMLKGHKLFSSIKKKFEVFKQTVDKDKIIDDFLAEVDTTFIYEEDIITYIIKEAIADYKKNSSKRIALIIEDLDRIDPAHLFRILNVFSAHMDNCYKYSTAPDNSLIGNKFGLDNVILVADYSNVRKIFSHFYGDETDFNGYISKFLSSTPFHYSLKEIRKEFIYDHIFKLTDCPIDIIKAFIDEDYLDNPTVRDLIHSFSIDNQIIRKTIFTIGNRDIQLDIRMLKLLSIMRRLKFSEEDIISIGVSYFKKAIESFYKYVAPYKLFLMNKASLIPDKLIVTIVHSNGNDLLSTEVHILDHGIGAAGETYYANSRRSANDIGDTIEYMLSFIAK